MCEPAPTKELIISHLYGKSEETCKVKVERNSRGYNWELSMSGPDFASCIKQIRDADEIMKGFYGNPVQ